MKYTVRPRTYWDSELEEEIVSPVTMTIHEDDETCEETGLLDRHGNPLMRIQEKAPLGFRLGKQTTGKS